MNLMALDVFRALDKATAVLRLENASVLRDLWTLRETVSLSMLSHLIFLGRCICVFL